MLDTSQSAATTIARWRAAGESGDAAVACLSPDIVLSLPLTEQFRLEGSDQLRDFLASAFTAVEDIHFHTETCQQQGAGALYPAESLPDRASGNWFWTHRVATGVPIGTPSWRSFIPGRNGIFSK